jgi:hypothetical protein
LYWLYEIISALNYNRIRKILFLKKHRNKPYSSPPPHAPTTIIAKVATVLTGLPPPPPPVCTRILTTPSAGPTAGLACLSGALSKPAGIEEEERERL